MMPTVSKGAMFVSRFLEDLGLFPEVYRVLGRIYSRIGGGNGCFESLKNMAEGTKIALSVVRRSIRILLEANIIRIVQELPGRTVVYDINPIEQWVSAKDIANIQQFAKQKVKKEQVKPMLPTTTQPTPSATEDYVERIYAMEAERIRSNRVNLGVRTNNASQINNNTVATECQGGSEKKLNPTVFYSTPIKNDLSETGSAIKSDIPTPIRNDILNNKTLNTKERKNKEKNPPTPLIRDEAGLDNNQEKNNNSSLVSNTLQTSQNKYPALKPIKLKSEKVKLKDDTATVITVEAIVDNSSKTSLGGNVMAQSIQEENQGVLAAKNSQSSLSAKPNGLASYNHSVNPYSQEVLNRVESYRNAWYNGVQNFNPFQLQEWAAVDGMLPVVESYRKSGRICNYAPNDISFEFACWLNRLHSKGSNKKDDAYGMNYIKSMERNPEKWGALTALVAQWQGSKTLGSNFQGVSHELEHIEKQNQLNETENLIGDLKFLLQF